MKIQYALMSCNSYPYYANYWPAAAAAWLKLGITPVCFFILDNLAYKLPKAPGGIVHTIPLLNDVPLFIQASFLRFWGSYFYPQAVCCVSDIDLVPLSKHYFDTQLGRYPNHAYVHLNPANYFYRSASNIPAKQPIVRKFRFLWAHFHIAKGEIMHKVLRLSSDWETTARQVTLYRPGPKKPEIVLSDFTPRSLPTHAEETYTSLQSHHSNYHPTFYISPNQYSGPIWDPLWNLRHQQKNSHWTFLHVFGVSYQGCEKIIEHLLTTGLLPKLRFNSQRLISLSKYPRAKIPIIGPWLSAFLNVVLWCILRGLSKFDPYSQLALVGLSNERSIILREHPIIKKVFLYLSRAYKLVVSK